MADEKTIASELSRIQAAKREISNAVLTRMQVEGLGQNPSITVLSEWLNNTRKGSNGEVDPSLGLQVYTGAITLKDGLDSTITLDGYYKDVVVDVEGGSGDIQLGLPGGKSVIVPGDTAQLFSPSNDGVYGYRDFTVSAVPKHYGNVNNLIEGTDASQILQGKTAYIKTIQNGEVVAQSVTGTMANRGNLTVELGTLPGQTGTHTVSPGYYTGGNIQLAADTVTTTTTEGATADQILSGRVAYVNGQKVTGNITNLTSHGIQINGDTIKLDKGYSDGNVTTTIAHATIKSPEYRIDTDGKMYIGFQVETGGYVAPGKNSINGEATIAVTPGNTITPSKSKQLATPKEHYTTGDVWVDPIPENYQDVSKVNATADQVLVGAKFVNQSGEVVHGNIITRESPNVVLDTSKGQYTIDSGYYTGGTIQIQTEAKSAILQQGEQTISPTRGHVLSEVIVPGVETYLENKVNVTADQVVQGAHFVDAGGTERTGTMTKRTGEFEWDYTESDKFPIPAGAYVAGETSSIGYEEWKLNDENNYGSTGLIHDWEEVNFRDEDYNWVGPFPEHSDRGYDCARVYIPNIPGNGQIISIENYGVGTSCPGPAGPSPDTPIGQGDEYYQAFLVDGTLYLAWYDENPTGIPQYLWIYNYTYGTPSAYVTMNSLIGALAAI